LKPQQTSFGIHSLISNNLQSFSPVAQKETLNDPNYDRKYIGSPEGHRELRYKLIISHRNTVQEVNSLDHFIGKFIPSPFST